MAQSIIDGALVKGNRCVFYTHRSFLFEQMVERFRGAGFMPSLRAPGWPWDQGGGVTLAMIQTVHSRCFRHKTAEPTKAEVVFIDEAHANKGMQTRDIIDWHHSDGALVIGLTATPAECGLYEVCAIGGSYSSALEHGLHLPCEMYAPSEPDMRRCQQVRGEYKESDLEERFQPHVIIGDVLSQYRIHNPEKLPAILYAPSVPLSIAMAEKLNKEGVVTAHLQGNAAVLPDGKRVASSRAVRDDLCAALLSGEIDMISNRFVLREGIDLPPLYIGFLATVMGLTGYIQSTGRLMRAHHSVNHKKVIDCGGNYHRHGLPNIDREWDITAAAHRQPRDSEREPWRCPKCAYTQADQGVCVQCGYHIQIRQRAVRSLNGNLRLVSERAPLNSVDSAQVSWKKLIKRAAGNRPKMPLHIFAGWYTKQTGVTVCRTGATTRLVAKDGSTVELTGVPHPGSNAWYRPIKDFL